MPSRVKISIQKKEKSLNVISQQSQTPRKRRSSVESMDVQGNENKKSREEESNNESEEGSILQSPDAQIGGDDSATTQSPSSLQYESTPSTIYYRQEEEDSQSTNKNQEDRKSDDHDTNKGTDDENEFDDTSSENNENNYSNGHQQPPLRGKHMSATTQGRGKHVPAKSPRFMGTSGAKRNIVSRLGINAGFSAAEPFFPDIQRMVHYATIDKNQTEIEKIKNEMYNNRDEDIELCESEETTFWANNHHLYDDFKKMLDVTTTGIINLSSHHAQDYKKVDPRRPKPKIHLTSFRKTIECWKEQHGTANTPVPVMMALHKMATRYMALYKEYKEDETDHFVTKFIEDSMPFNVNRKRKKKEREERRKRRKQQKKQEIARKKKEATEVANRATNNTEKKTNQTSSLRLHVGRVVDFISEAIHTSGLLEFQQNQIDVLKDCGLGFRRKAFPALYDDSNLPGWCLPDRGIDDNFVFSHPIYHYGFLPPRLKVGLRSIIDDEKITDPFFRPYFVGEEFAPMEFVRSWNVDRYKFQFPPKKPVTEGIDAKFFNFFQQIFPDEVVGFNMGYAETELCSACEGPDDDPMFHYGQPRIDMTNNIFDIVTSRSTPWDWRVFNLHQRIATMKIPRYNSEVHFIYLNEEMTTIPTYFTDKCKTKKLPVDTRNALLDNLWKQAHYCSWEMHNNMNKYGILDREAIKVFKFHVPYHPEDLGLDLSDMIRMGYILIDVKGDGNCGFHALFLALVNAQLIAPSLQGMRNLIQFLKNYTIEDNVIKTRRDLGEYIKNLDPCSWMWHELFHSWSGEATETIDMRTPIPEYIEDIIGTLYQENVDYANLNPYDVDYFPDCTLYPLFLAMFFKIRVVMIVYKQGKNDSVENEKNVTNKDNDDGKKDAHLNGYDTFIYDYREGQKSTSEYAMYPGIYRIPDEDFNYRDTIELFYQQKAQYRTQEEIEASNNKAKEKGDEEDNSISNNGANETPGDNTEEVPDKKVEERKLTSSGHYKWILREACKDDKVSEEEGILKKCEKWSKSIENSRVLSIPLSMPNGPMISTFVINYNVQLDKNMRKLTYEGIEEAKRPIIMINYKESELSEEDKRCIQRTIEFYLICIYDILHCKHKIMPDKVPKTHATGIKWPTPNIIDNAYKKIKSGYGKPNQQLDLQVIYPDEALLPPAAGIYQDNIRSTLCACSARFFFAERDKIFDDSIADKDKWQNLSLKHIWNGASNCTTLDEKILEECYQAVGAKLLINTLYIKAANILAYGEMNDKEKQERERLHHFGEGLIVRKEDEMRFLNFVEENAEIGKKFYESEPEREKVSNNDDDNSQGDIHNANNNVDDDKDEENKDRDAEDEDSESELGDIPKMSAERKINPTRIDLDEAYNPGLTKTKIKELNKLRDDICPEGVEQIYDIKRIQSIATILTKNNSINYLGKKDMDNDVLKNLSGKKKNYAKFIRFLEKMYDEYEFSDKNERTTLTSKTIPPAVKAHSQQVNQRRIKSQKIDFRVTYNHYEKGAMAMELVETMQAQIIQMDERDSLKQIIKKKEDHPDKFGPITEEEEERLADLINSVEILENNILDKLDVFFPVNEDYGHSETREGNEIRKLRFQNDRYYGLSTSKQEQLLETNWVNQNFHRTFLGIVKWLSTQTSGTKTKQRKWVHIPAGDPRKPDNKNRTSSEIEMDYDIKFIQALKIEYPQGSHRYCVTCSFASALHLLYLDEAAKLILTLKKDISRLPGKVQIQLLHCFSKEGIDPHYVNSTIMYLKQKKAARINPETYSDPNTLLFIIPQSKDGATSHAFAIVNLQGTTENRKIIVDANDPHPLIYSSSSLDYVCGKPHGFKHVELALKIKFKNFNVSLVDEIIRKIG